MDRTIVAIVLTLVGSAHAGPADPPKAAKAQSIDAEEALKRLQAGNAHLSPANPSIRMNHWLGDTHWKKSNIHLP